MFPLVVVTDPLGPTPNGPDGYRIGAPDPGVMVLQFGLPTPPAPGSFPI